MGTPGVSTFEWTDAATDRAVAMWAEGCSEAAIAGALGAEFGGRLTRNGVLGKLHRLAAKRPVGEARTGVAAKPVRAPKRPRAGGLRDLVAAQRARPAAKPKKGQVQGDGFASEPKAPQLALVAGPAYAPLPGFAPVRLVDHQNHQCRWPIDIEGEHASRCCGAPRDGEHVYCAPHRLRAVAAVTPGRPGKVTMTELQTRKRSA